MNRFFVKSVISFFVGALAFSPLVFSFSKDVPIPTPTVAVATVSAADCSVVKAIFDKGNNSSEVNSYVKVYASDATASNVQLTVWTQNCAGKKLAVSLLEQDGSTGSIVGQGSNNTNNTRIHIDGTNQKYTYQLFNVPASDSVALNFKVGEEECDIVDPECSIYATFSSVNSDDSVGDQIFSTQDKISDDGMLFYNCRDDKGAENSVGSNKFCDTFWSFISTQPVNVPPPTNGWYYKSIETEKYRIAVGAKTKEECDTYAKQFNGDSPSGCMQNPPFYDIAEGEVSQVSPNSGTPDCWVGFSNGAISVSGCFAQILYYVLYVPTSWLFMIAGMFFDYTFDYSIQSSSYNNDFIVQAWTLVRDLCNVMFIVVMMYIAVGTLLGFSGVDWRKMVLNIIIVAVTINFSLFVSRIIIDFGNVTARLFYNSDTISITKMVDGKPVVSHGMSEAIVSGFDPQNIVLQGQDKMYSNVEDRAPATTKDTSNTTFILITICAIALNVIGAGIFFKIALLFIGRVIGLWVSTIKSPMAFLSNALPQKWRMGMSLSSWFGDTFQASFMATIFMAFMYVILLFVQVISRSSNSFFSGNMAWILTIVIPFVFIIKMLSMAEEKARSWSGEIARELAGKLDSKMRTVGGLAVGGAVGLAAGGAAAVGRSTIGKFANGDNGAKLAERLAAAEAKGGIRGKIAGFGLKNFEKTKDASFDIRNNKTFGKGMAMVDKNANINVSAGLNSQLIQATPFEARTTGRASQIKEEKEKVKKEINRQSKISHVSDSQFKEYHNEQVTRYKDKYEKEVKNKKPANFETMGVDEKARWEAEFKKNYEAKYGKQFEALGEDAKESDIKAMRKQVEEARRKKLLERLDAKDFTTTGAVVNAVRNIKNWNGADYGRAGGVVAGATVAGTQGFTGTAVGNAVGAVAGASATTLAVGAVAGVGLAGAAITEDIQVRGRAYAEAKKDLEKEWKKDEKKVEELEKKVKNDERTLANQIATLNNDANLFVTATELLNNAEMRQDVPEIVAIVKAIQESDSYKDIAKEKAKVQTERDEKAAALAAESDTEKKKKLEKELDTINDKIRGFSLEFATVFETELAKKGGEILEITNKLKKDANAEGPGLMETQDEFKKRKAAAAKHLDTMAKLTEGYTTGADRRIRGIDNKDKIESRLNKNKEALDGMGKPKDDKKADDKKK